jgi:putative endonuclease
MGGWVYIMTNKPHGTIYVGVTSNLARRVWEHSQEIVPGFTKRYGLKRLVYMEPHEDITDAIRREKAIKAWLRAWKVNLIQAEKISGGMICTNDWLMGFRRSRGWSACADHDVYY